MVSQLGIIFAFLGLGEFIVWGTGIPVPSSIIGMLLLTASLKAGIVPLDRVEKVSAFLVGNFGFFFVPAAVGLINCFGIIRQQWLPILMMFLASSVIVLGCTGWIHQYLSSRSLKKIEDDRVSA